MPINCNIASQLPDYKTIILYFYMWSYIMSILCQGGKILFLKGYLDGGKKRSWNASQLINLGGHVREPSIHELVWGVNLSVVLAKLNVLLCLTISSEMCILEAFTLKWFAHLNKWVICSCTQPPSAPDCP